MHSSTGKSKKPPTLRLLQHLRDALALKQNTHFPSKSADRTHKPWKIQVLLQDDKNVHTCSRAAGAPGLAPSAMEKERVRMWSATTRYAMSSPSLSSLPT
jgi:hypothetical protein